MVDTRDLKSLAPKGRAGSSPALGTMLTLKDFNIFISTQSGDDWN
jgi:hypothetical protein